MQNNWQKMIRTNRLFDAFDLKDIRNGFSIREMILNDYSGSNAALEYKAMVMRYTDFRIMSLFDEIKAYRDEKLKRNGCLSDVHNHISQYKNSNNKDNCDIARFFFLNLSYFLRNKYFHAEKGIPNFIFYNTESEKELNKIATYFKCYLCDLFENSSLYMD